MGKVVGFIGGIGPVEIFVWLLLLFVIVVIFWLIRRPLNKRIDEIEANSNE